MVSPPKRRKKIALDEIEFDSIARNEYLTGFHKRKLQRKQQALEEAEKKERADKVEGRKLLRQQRKVDLENHVQQVNAEIKNFRGVQRQTAKIKCNPKPSEDELDTGGIEYAPEDLYVDEDAFALVTVEPMDLHSHVSLAEHDAIEKRTALPAGRRPRRDHSLTVENVRSLSAEYTKRRRKKFRYESRAERKISRNKEQMMNSVAAQTRRGT